MRAGKGVSLTSFLATVAACSVGGGPSSPPTGGGAPIGATLVSCASPSSDIVTADAHHATDLAALNALAPPSDGARPSRSGAWSDPGTWGGSVPNGGAVVIPKGIGVIIDSQLGQAYTSVRIDGCLEFARTVNTRLRTDLLFVAAGGEIWVGSPSQPIAASVTAEVTFPASGPIDIAKDKNLLGKGFVAVSKTNVVGASKTTRRKVSTAPLKGATTIALEAAPSGWAVGDRVVLTGTRWVKFFDVNGIRRAKDAQDEELTITAINGASVTVSPALKFDHDGPRANLLPYLVNFSRNVRFATENASTVKVSERAHAMFMSPQTVIHGAEFNQMGRTDKSRRAIAISAMTTLKPDLNVKGRYPLHLHKTGGAGCDRAADVQNVAIWGSPGWGVAQHSGSALLADNAVYNAFGAGFVAESGDETGAWVSNIAIRSEGVAEIVKDAASIAALDLGRTGDGYWLQGRLLHLHNNVAAGMGGGIGFVYMHRGTDIVNANPISSDMVLQPAAFRYADQKIETPNIQQFTDNETFASATGFHVVKYGPRQAHGVRTVLDGFTAWEVGSGVELTYVSHYTVRDALIIGARNRPSSVGVEFGTNTYDLAVANSRIEDFDNGIVFAHDWTTVFAPSASYIAANIGFQNIRNSTYFKADATDVIIHGPAPKVKPSLAFSWGANLPVWRAPLAAGTLKITGVLTDSAGTGPYPVATDEFILKKINMESLLETDGYYSLADGRRVAVAPEHFTDRVTGEIDLTSLLIEIDPGNSLAKYRNRGLLDLGAPAPKAVDDTAVVSRDGSIAIDALANDQASGGALSIVGLTTPRQGAAKIDANGRINYAPYPGFRGSDAFTYFVRSSQGRFSKARVRITVQ